MGAADGVVRLIPASATFEEQISTTDPHSNFLAGGGLNPLFGTGGFNESIVLISVIEKRLEKLTIFMLLFAFRIDTTPRKLFIYVNSRSSWLEKRGD
jgi:hypothetical protein